MRRKRNLSLISSAMFLLASCGSTPHTVAEKYYFIVPATKSPYWQQVMAGLNRASRDLQVSVSMIGPETYDPKTQREDFRRIAATRPAGIMVSAGDPSLMAPEIDAAIANGVPVITVDSDSASSKRLFFVGTNNFQAGQMAARALVKFLNGKGNVVAFLTAHQSNLEERLDGYRAFLDGHPQIRITEVVDLKGDPKIAFDKATELLSKGKPSVDAFISMEGQSGKEVAEVLKRRKASKVVIAMDALNETLSGIEEGLITATVAQKPFTMGYMSLRLMADLNLNKLPSLTLDFAKDPNALLPRFVDTGAALVDKSNLAAYREGAK
jgi:ribose transport system substrate-binding protein